MGSRSRLNQFSVTLRRNRARVEAVMFFAETLGSVLTTATGEDFYDFVKAKLAGRQNVASPELRALASEFLTRERLRVTPEALIGLIASNGRIVFEADGATAQTSFRLAA